MRVEHRTPARLGLQSRESRLRLTRRRTSSEGTEMANVLRYVTVVLVANLSLWPAWTSGTQVAQPGDTVRQSTAFVGSDLFRTYCATCHGQGARGDGPLAEMLKKRPADLTVFARKNDGVFPADLVGRIIDGRQPVAGHGGKDMPVWGDAFRQASGGSDEASIKARIDALVQHLQTIQVK